jgi:hypothetical protein
MVENEAIRQEHEVTAEEVATCDLCGRSVASSLLQRIAGKQEVAEPIEELHVCPDCWLAIERDEVSYDEEIAAALRPVDE